METKGVDKVKSNPNILSKLTLCWVCPVLFNGNKRDVEESDLIPPSRDVYQSDVLGAKFQKEWLLHLENCMQRNKEPSLFRTLIKTFWLSYMPSAILLLGNVIPRTIEPLLFSQLLSYWSAESTMSRLEASFYALGMVGLLLMGSVCFHHNSLFVGRFGMKIRVATCSLIYRKVTRMSQSSLKEVATGKLVNLMSNDVGRFDFAFLFLHYFWLIPLQASVALYFMFTFAGFAPFVGLFGVLLLIMPIQVGLTKLTAIFRRETAQRTDKRIKLMNEIINSIQVIKMYAWEIPFQKMVKAARDYELLAVRRAGFVQGTFGGFMMFTERSTLFFTILTIILTGNMATAAVIYPIQQYFRIVQSSFALILPMAITNLTEMMVTLERIQKILLLEEREDLSLMPKTQNFVNNIKFKSKSITSDNSDIIPKRYSKTIPATNGVSNDMITSEPRLSQQTHAIEFSNVSVSWLGNKDQLTLKNISLKIPKGKLCAVIGPVGCGKSSFLQVLLKELPVLEGRVNVYGRVSYACQESWLFSESVRQNILFGLPYDSAKYKEVCDVCCLKPDFKQFPFGDQSLVGERGVSLSGGQRARINLARCLYREAEIYLLDDPLSAVDANVARQLFERCIRGYLRQRTCIIVTHQIHLVKAADYIVILNEGSLESMGSYDDLKSSDKTFPLLLASLEDKSDAEEDESKEGKPPLMREVSTSSTASARSSLTAFKEQKIAAEERSKGSMKWKVVAKYFSSVKSYPLILVTLLIMLITQGAAVVTDYWISFWTNQVDDYIQNLPAEEEPDPSLDVQTGLLQTWQFVLIHGLLVLTIIVCSFLRLFGYVSLTLRASANLHNAMFSNLICAVMRFFETNPSGRVLNRFSKDMGALDENLPRAALQSFQMYLVMLSVLILNAISLPWTLIPTVALISIFLVYLKWYLNAAQAVKRLEGTTKSPMFSMINSTLSGISTIRSSNSETMLIKNFDTCQDLHTSAYNTYLGGSAAFGFYLDMICLVYLASILSIFILVDFGDIIPVGSVGLAVSQSLSLMMMLQLTARFTADFLAQMTAVERVLEYTNLPPEKDIHEGPTKPPVDWPTKGQITFENVNLRYSPDSPLVLKNINFEIKNGWKVGVVGRTGAGKSSLITSLFQLANVEGSIKIDGLDIRGIAKQTLRSKISIIPQEPILFSATIRYNLDPFDVYNDDDIWRALEQVELKDAIPALDYIVSAGGSNFSVGQRQLICLARAILRSNKILVMDEATANVDPQTDALIQKTIRQESAAFTVITIAHRLNTIMDSNRVLVMNNGEVSEFDHPHTLLSNPQSLFTFMVNETGDTMSNILREVAKNKYFNDINKSKNYD